MDLSVFSSIWTDAEEESLFGASAVLAVLAEDFSPIAFAVFVLAAALSAFFFLLPSCFVLTYDTPVPGILAVPVTRPLVLIEPLSPGIPALMPKPLLLIFKRTPGSNDIVFLNRKPIVDLLSK